MVGQVMRSSARAAPTAIQKVVPKVRRVEADSVLTGAEFARVQQLRESAAGKVSALVTDLQNLEAALRGRTTSTEVQQLAPRISLYRSALASVKAVPAVEGTMTVSDILSAFSQYGLRDRSFDTVVPVTAPNPINSTGTYYDAGAVFDAWILNPSIDTKIDFNGPPNQNTPFISANSRMQFQVRAQKVYYLSQNPGLVGTMQVWLLKFSVT